MNFEIVYQSLLTFASGIVPSGVAVVEGESYGVRYLPPTGPNPSVAVTIEDVTEASVELGSFASSYFVTMHIVAQSRKQRDALKTIVYSGLVHNAIAISGGSSGEAHSVTTRDVLDFQSNRERLFWAANVFCGVTILG